MLHARVRSNNVSNHSDWWKATLWERTQDGEDDDEKGTYLAMIANRCCFAMVPVGQQWQWVSRNSRRRLADDRICWAR